jgi:hypothetical protein
LNFERSIAPAAIMSKKSRSRQIQRNPEMWAGSLANCGRRARSATPTQQTLPATGQPVRNARLLILQKRFYLLVELLERHGAFESLAIDEEGRCRIDLQYLVGEFLIGGELVEQRLILCAGFDSLFSTRPVCRSASRYLSYPPSADLAA